MRTVLSPFFVSPALVNGLHPDEWHHSGSSVPPRENCRTLDLGVVEGKHFMFDSKTQHEKNNIEPANQQPCSSLWRNL
jgi:hypothetical protein